MSPFRGLDLVKRETGENPVRTRHCIQGAGAAISLGTRKSFPGKMADVMIYEPGDLPAVVQEQLFQPTSNWEYIPRDKIKPLSLSF